MYMLKINKFGIILYLALNCAYGQIDLQPIEYPYEGYTRLWETSINNLIPNDPRMLGMGNVGITNANTTNSYSQNPASLGKTNEKWKSFSISYGYKPLYPEFINRTEIERKSQTFVSFCTQPFENIFGGFGFRINLMSIGDNEYVDNKSFVSEDVITEILLTLVSHSIIE